MAPNETTFCGIITQYGHNLKLIYSLYTLSKIAKNENKLLRVVVVIGKDMMDANSGAILTVDTSIGILPVVVAGHTFTNIIFSVAVEMLVLGVSPAFTVVITGANGPETRR